MSRLDNLHILANLLFSFFPNELLYFVRQAYFYRNCRGISPPPQPPPGKFQPWWGIEWKSSFFVVIPVILAAVEETTNLIEGIDTDELNALFACIRRLYALIYLIATCPQSILPRARTEQILYPDFCGSYFPGRDLCSQWEMCICWNRGEIISSSDSRHVTVPHTFYQAQAVTSSWHAAYTWCKKQSSPDFHLASDIPRSVNVEWLVYGQSDYCRKRISISVSSLVKLF